MKSAPIADPVNPSIRMSGKSFQRIAEFIRREVGILMPVSKSTMVQARLGSRVRELGMESIDQYCEHLFSIGSKDAERIYLINAVTTNKTDFFREAQHFKHLTDKAVPELTRVRKSTVNIWSAACSTGEEPYTIAMVLSDYAMTRPGFVFRIVGSDISTKVLDVAKAAVYTRVQAAAIPPDVQRRYLVLEDGGKAVRVQPALRQTVSFRPLNLMASDYGVFEHFDVIFCRNVLIYFDPPTREAVINKLCRHLTAGGYLFIGHTESLGGLKVPLIPDSPACFRKRPN